MAEKFACQTRKSSGPGFEFRSDHHLDLFLRSRVSPEFKSSTSLVNMQPTGLPLA